MQTFDANAAAAPVSNKGAQAEALATDGATVQLLVRQPPLAIYFHEWRTLFAMAREQFWFLPAMVVLALLTSLFEGVGLTLIVPLVQSLGQEGGPPMSGGYLDFLQGLVSSIPSADRTVAVLGLMFAAILAKSVFSYANMALLGVVYGRISHRLRTAIFNRIV